MKEPGGWCHLGIKEVWVNIPSFGSREDMSSCPSMVYLDIAVPKHPWKVRIWFEDLLWKGVIQFIFRSGYNKLLYFLCLHSRDGLSK